MIDRDSKRWMALLAGLPALKLVIHLVLIRGYGMFRDEFYYLACSERLAFGYVDHPPLSLLLLRAVRFALGDSVPAVRLLPALAGAATVAIVGLMVREMRGGRFAAGLAMTGTIAVPTYLGINHYYSMNAFELLFWALAAYLSILICNGEGPWLPRLWAALGIVLGLGLQNKISVLWLGLGLAVAWLATPLRRTLATPGPWIAGALALALFAPHLIWQAAHDWPTVDFVRSATQNKMVEVSIGDFASGQIDAMGPLILPLWLSGLVFFFLPAGRRYRALGWIYLTVFVLLATGGSSRSGYLAPAYTWLMAGGGIAIERWTSSLGGVWRAALRVAALVVVVASGAISAPFAIPLLPIERYISYAKALDVQPETAERKELAQLPQWYADMHGWESIAETVAGVYESLSPDERARAVIFTGNYGEAGAISYFGRRRGLPPAISSHNNYWLWGPGERPGEILIAVGVSAEGVGRRYADVEEAAMIDCGYCMPYENDRPVFLARNPHQPLQEIWPELRHFD